ncbi:unnamed protein product [Phytomonas sp. Hart1]|nr:unnamed protein product [Phytomonas sp. Hart1]|eukprot:CCW66238.1 unnamed protein product [Phytomonas sp. isolate Hart1]
MVSWINFGTDGVLGAALSLSVTTMGAGILTLPSAYADAGIVLATLLMVFIAVMTVYSIDFIVHSIEKLGLNSYEEITRRLFGRKAEEMVRITLVTYLTGCAVSYLVVIGDLLAPLQPILSQYVKILLTPRHTLFLYWAFFVLPLSCVSNLGSLHGISFLAITSTLMISGMVVYRYFVPNSPQVGDSFSKNGKTAAYMNSQMNRVSWWWGKNFLLTIPITMFSFDCQSLVFQIYAGLNNMSRRTMFTVATVSLIISTTIHGVVGLFGYLTNPTDVRENIINNYDPTSDRLFAVGYMIYLIPINLAFILLVIPIRDSVFILWYGYSQASVATHVPQPNRFVRIVDEEEQIALLSSENNLDTESDILMHMIQMKKKALNTIETISMRDHMIVSISLSMICITVALFIPNIVSIIAPLGAICSSTLCFTLPGLYRWKLNQLNISKYANTLEQIQTIALIILGIFSGVVGTIVSIIDFF